MTAPAYTRTCNTAKKNASSKTNNEATPTKDKIMNIAAVTGLRLRITARPPPTDMVAKT